MLDLSELSPETRQLVQDARYRARVTSILLEGDPASAEALRARDAIDAAVVEILAAAALPRGPIDRIVVEPVGQGWFGRKTATCRLLIDSGEFTILPVGRQPDSLIRTWIHESLHARQVYVSGYAAEWRDALGFEEGMVEGLTRRIVVDALALHPILPGYHTYVAAYESLAEVLAFDVVDFWRELWSAAPAGGVSGVFMDALMRVRQPLGRTTMTRMEQTRLFLAARRIFGTRRTMEKPDTQALIAAWEAATP